MRAWTERWCGTADLCLVLRICLLRGRAASPVLLQATGLPIAMSSLFICAC